MLLPSCQQSDGPINEGTSDTTGFIKLPLRGDTNYKAVSFPTATTGYVGTEDGRIYKTTDGGDHWTVQQLSIGSGVAIMQFLDENIGFVSDTSSLSKTVDGGASWTFLSATGGASFLGIQFVNEMVGYGAALQGIWKTIDGGKTWSSTTPGEGMMYSVSFPSPDTGYAVGWNGAILKTTDGAAHWARQKEETSRYEAIECSDVNTCYAAGGGEIVKTSDGGATWAKQPNPITVWIADLKLLDANRAYAVGTDGDVIQTANGGDTWTQIRGGNNEQLYAVALPDTKTIIAAGQDVVLRRRTP